MSTTTAVYLSGATIMFIALTLTYTQLPESARWGLAKPWEVFVRALILAAMWPFMLVVFAAVLASPRLMDWIQNGSKG